MPVAFGDVSTISPDCEPVAFVVPLKLTALNGVGHASKNSPLICPFNGWDHPDSVIQVVGLEPTRVSPPHFECGASTNSATPARSRLQTLKARQWIEDSLNHPTRFESETLSGCAPDQFGSSTAKLRFDIGVATVEVVEAAHL